MSLIKCYYTFADLDLDCMISVCKELSKGETKRTNLMKVIKDYVSFFKNYYGVKRRFDLFGYGRRLETKLSKHASIIKSAFNNRLKDTVLSKEACELFVYLTDIASLSFSKAQYGHLWGLAYKIYSADNFGDVMQGHDSNHAAKALSEIKKTYEVYTYSLSKSGFVPEVKRAYELAIAMIENAGEPAEEVEVKTEEIAKELA